MLQAKPCATVSLCESTPVLDAPAAPAGVRRALQVPFASKFASTLHLAVTHSEGSTREARAAWSAALGCPVRDEYSSEEATRIALELPCGHYHVCEDAVMLEVRPTA